jgi:hypothetical protein
MFTFHAFLMVVMGAAFAALVAVLVFMALDQLRIINDKE